MIRNDLAAAIGRALAEAGLPEPGGGITLEPTTRREHGDWTTNFALQLAKQAGMAPRAIAEDIAGRLTQVPHLEKVEIAGPGFLNLFLKPTWLHAVLSDVIAQDTSYGKGDALEGERINLEFVSANPTGPLHAGGGRWVAVGDAIANLLATQGAVVHREYYLNDAGSQLDNFAESLMARYRGEAPPQDGYQGEYVTKMAEHMRADLGDGVTVVQAGNWGYAEIVREVKADLARIGVNFDTWFSERTLHERGDVTAVIELLTSRGHTSERDGATWLNTEALGDNRDRVLVKSDGTTTYLAADIAYHRDKLARGWTHLIDIWGADHHGQVRSLQVGLEATGARAQEPEVLLGQLVKLVRGGEPVRISKRTGNTIALADILDEVDPDAARLTFLMQGIETAQTIDLEVITSQSMENPVYYVQYAHARACSVAKIAAERGITRSAISKVDLGTLVDERELDLLRSLAEYPDMLSEAAARRAPHKVTTWVRELAGRFHGFYRDCRVISEDAELTQARLWLVEASRLGLANALGVLGVSAPTEMRRLEEEEELAQ